MGRKRRKTRLDIHVHTPTSDGRGTPEEYVAAIGAAELDGICITDHHVDGGEASRKIQRAVRAAGFLCFAGCEYSTAQGHLLVYGADVASLELGLYPEMQEAVWRVRDAGGVAIPAHPFYGWRRRLSSKVYDLADLVAVEGANGKLAVEADRWNDSALEAARNLGLAVTGSSDAHWASDIGLCWTEFDGAIRRPGEFVRALLGGEYVAWRDDGRLEEKRRSHVAARQLPVPLGSLYPAPDAFDENTVGHADTDGDDGSDLLHQWLLRDGRRRLPF